MKKLFNLTLAIALIATGLTFTSCENNGSGLTGKYTTKYVDEHLPGGYWVNKEEGYPYWVLTFTKEISYFAVISDLTLENFNNKKVRNAYGTPGYTFTENTQRLYSPNLVGKLIKLTATELTVDEEEIGMVTFIRYQNLP